MHPTFHHKAHKQLRMALRPLLATVAGQLGSFGVDPAGYKDAKQAKKDRNRRIMMERAADREAKDKTRMRAERLTRLAALERGHDEVLALGEAERISAIGDGDGDGDGGRGCHAYRSRIRPARPRRRVLRHRGRRRECSD